MTLSIFFKGKALIGDKPRMIYLILFFQSFSRGDVAYFDGLIETILAVGLVKPKRGMQSLFWQHFFCPNFLKFE